MNIKLQITTAMILLSMAVTSIGHASPYWDAENPGVPSGTLAGHNNFSLSDGPATVVATNGTVYAIASDDFGSYIVAWSYCSDWVPLVSFPYAIGASAPVTLCLGENRLYVGGGFTNLTIEASQATVNATNIAVFNLTNGIWSDLGNAEQFSNNAVTAIAVDANQRVYIGTQTQYNFSGNPYPFVTNAVMAYSNNNWVSLGPVQIYGVYTTFTYCPSSTVAALAAEGTDIYVIGNFIGGSNDTTFIESTNIIKWNGVSNAWQSMNSSLWGTVVSGRYNSGIGSIAVCGTNVFVAGIWAADGYNYDFPSGFAGVTIFSTNGTWLGNQQDAVNLESGPSPCETNGVGISLAVQNGTVYVGGVFTYTGTDGCTGSSYNSIAQWTNGVWLPLSTGVLYDGSPTGVYALAADAESVYVFGEFSTAGGFTATNGARWVTTNGSADPCVNCWSLTGWLDTPRRFHTATLLPDGNVLAAGGFDSTYLLSVELYDGMNGTWTNTDSMTTEVNHHEAALLTNGLVLVAGGQGTLNEATNRAELYYPASGSWTNTGSLNSPRVYYTLTILTNGLVLASAGYNGNVPEQLLTAELYYPGTGTWSNTGSLNVARESHTATLLTNGLVLVAGGDNSSGALTDSELYYPETGMWTNTGVLNKERYAHTATLLTNGLVLVAGGIGSAGSATNSAELYYPASGTWTNTGSMITARYYHTATLLNNGLVLVEGGENSGGALDEAEIYNPSTGTWTATCSLNTPCFGQTATLFTNGLVLEAGGDSGSVSISNAEIYYP